MKEIIDHTNYKDYFLLYVDDELEAPERAAVALFIAQHPQLKPELDSLLQAKLPADDAIRFPDKSRLFFDKPGVPDEAILLFLDNEQLDEAIKQQLQYPTPELQQRMDLFRKTIATPDRALVFSKKEQLYRNAKVGSFKNWKIVAAAAVLILAVGYGLFKGEQKKIRPADLAEERIKGPVVLAPDTEGAIINTDTIYADAAPASTPVRSASKDADVVKEPLQKNNPVVYKEKKPAQTVPDIATPNKTSGTRKPAMILEPSTAPVVTQQPEPAAKTVESPLRNINPPEATAGTTVANKKPVKEKKSLFKKLTKRIEEKVSETFDDGDGQVTVAGFAFNVK